jgi:ketosteroid isomerase-like protein
MSRENVEIVRLIFDRWAEGDFQAGRELLHPDIEWVISREHPDARTLIGHQAVADYRREWQTVVPNMRLELDQVLDGGDKVVTIGAAHGTGTASGADVRVPIAFVFTLRDGLIARAEEYLDPDEALEAVGLAE